MFRKLYLIPFLFAAKTVFSQANPSEKFGVLLENQQTQTIFPIDSSAEAIVLYEKYKVEFIYDSDRQKGFYTRNYMHIRKKILKKSAFDLAVVTIPYYSGQSGNAETIDNIKGVTLNFGEKTDLDKKSIFDEKIEGNYRQRKLTFPNVKEGSIIEYEYFIDTPMTVSEKPRTWAFQGANPTLWSEIELTIPYYFYFKILHTGYLPLDINEQEKTTLNSGYSPPTSTSGLINNQTEGVRYRFVVKNAPAFKNEPFITTTSDYISKVGFELAQVALPGEYTKNYSIDWSDIDKTLLESDNWGRKMKKNNYLSDLTKELNANPDPKDRLQKAYDYMVKNFKWNEETGLWILTDLKKVFENKTGSASELNGLMIALLRELKIEANPVITSTRRNGRVVFTFPQIDNFNYTLLQAIVDKDTLLIDVTDPYIKLGSLPQRCINEAGRLIKANNKGELIYINPKEKYAEFETYNIHFDKEFTKISGNYSGSSNGYAGHDLRAELKSSGEDIFKKGIIASYKEMQISNLKFEDAENLENAFTAKFDYTKDSDAGGSDRIYLEPILFGKVEKNPFNKPTRNFPVNFGHATNQIIMANVEIPEGYEVEELPKNIGVTLPDNGGKFTYIISKADKLVTVQSRLILNKWIYSAEEYQYLSELYSRVVQKHAEQIILKKK